MRQGFQGMTQRKLTTNTSIGQAAYLRITLPMRQYLSERCFFGPWLGQARIMDHGLSLGLQGLLF